MAQFLRVLFLPALFLLAACGAPAPQKKAPVEPSKESWYQPAIEELRSVNAAIARFADAGEYDKAARAIIHGQELEAKLLSSSHPPLEAAIAVSDLEDIYGRMMLAQKKYGWARLVFQKNLARWKYWRPITDDSQARMERARQQIIECDRGIEKK